jgi:predicted porin
MNATNEVEIYGRIGWMQNNINGSIEAKTYSNDITLNQYFWWLGAAYKITESFSAIIDFTRLQQKEETDISFTAIGLRYKF